MNGMYFTIRMTLVILLLTTVTSHAANVESGVTYNPFKRPKLVHTTSNIKPAHNSERAPVHIDLRSTLSAGNESLVNVGGEIIGMGDEIGGYRLLSVSEGAAVFFRGETQVTVTVDSYQDD